ncbi:hypothetical protein MMF93_01605 [Streptomyces tubbatahanensis]|uniref:Integral membrane protein n=1 Tax=Streptomyces tubbatahanensis TaxID=2923272 RepID=A0ABY3XLK2_9ACTN|nr:hypothetical protein [Streptomyces tubbatahanensis]UNS95306.1 hypothetical protein MMF93_01605 [Streptomyces tubbatahanensis]
MHEMRYVLVRCCALLLGSAAVWAGLHQAAEPYRTTVQFRHARPCPSNSPAETSACVGRENGRVADKYTVTHTSGDSDDTTTHTSYYLRVERGSGRTAKYEVSSGLHGAARRGSRAGLEVWRGQVVGITVRGSRDRLTPDAADDLLFNWWCSWIGAGVALWSVLGSGRPRGLFGPLGSRAGAWVWLGLCTALPASRIAAHGTAGWGILGWSAVWLLGAAVSVGAVVAFREEADGTAGGRWFARRSRRRMRARPGAG